MFQQRNSGWTRRIVVSVTVFAMAASTCAVGASATVGAVPEQALADVAVPRGGEPNIVLILTDDQRFDTLWAMPTVQSQLVAKGIEFTKGYVSNAVCCPSRSTILTGQYSHLTGVYTNHPGEPYGGFPAFHDGSTVATWLHADGYWTPCWAST